VLITAHADIDAAMQAINEARAFAFLTKPWNTDELLAVVRRAVDAHHVLARQRGVSMRVHQRELANLELLSITAAPAPLTAQSFGASALHERDPESYAELLQGYAEALEQSFEQRIYRVDNHISDTLVALADRLGRLRAGPRDVVDLHTTALKRRLATVVNEEAEAYAEEGRLLILELMGHLVSYYRLYTLGVGT
jgi:response regulator RpfG family c-di-GMP phosphodiesterase